MSRFFRPLSAIAIASLGALTLGGCEISIGSSGTKIAGDKVEKEIAKGFEEKAAGTKVKSVACPEKISAKKGTTVTCVMTLEDESTGDIKVKVTDNDGNVRWDVAESAK